jgi:mitogen-activated protein kinase 7
VNKDCELRICDFGMARSFDQADNTSYLTEYVTTRWYRAPEVMISSQNYSKASMCNQKDLICVILFNQTY